MSANSLPFDLMHLSEGPGITLDLPDGDHRFKFEDHYELKNPIAKGSFGTVHVTKHKASEEEFAVKVINRKRLSEREQSIISREISILRDCRDAKSIVRMVDFYVSPEYIYLVQIYAEGGDVFERLASRTTYNEKEARNLAVRLIQAVQFLHYRKIAHRDLKPENLLLRSMLDDSEILVADFGFASYVPHDGLKTRCGTPAFVAPEVIEMDCRYDERVDMWSVGCLLYMLIGGYPPFQAPNHRMLFRKIRGADFCFHDQYFKNVSVSSKQLIASMLTIDPNYRCTAKMALEKSHWLKIQSDWLENADLSASLGEMRRFQARSSLKGAMHTVLWSVRSKFKSVDEAGFSDQIKEWDKTDEARERFDKAYLTSVRPTLKFADVYELRDQLHRGTSTIWSCWHTHQEQLFAVKVIDRRHDHEACIAGRKSAIETVLHEVAVLNALDHPNIIKTIDFFDEEDHFYLVMEYMEGGDLFDRITNLEKYTEKDARDFARVLLEAVAYLHEGGHCHRDLKPQNILLKSKDNHSELKIADFSFACRVHTPQSLTTRCGTPTYVAPEILKNIPYDQSADMWSVGVILYVLLCGHPPFADDNQLALFEKIRMGEYSMRGPEWDRVTDDAKAVISNLLQVNPRQRWSARTALRSQWLRDDDEYLVTHDLAEAVSAIRHRKYRLKSIAKTIIWMNRRGDTSKALKSVETLLSRTEVEQGKVEYVFKPDESIGDFDFMPEDSDRE